MSLFSGLLIALLAFRAAFIEAFDFEGCEGCDRDGDTGLCDCETGENALLRIKRQGEEIMICS